MPANWLTIDPGYSTPRVSHADLPCRRSSVPQWRFLAAPATRHPVIFESPDGRGYAFLSRVRGIAKMTGFRTNTVSHISLGVIS